MTFSYLLTEKACTIFNKMLSKDSFHSKSQQIYEYRLFLKLLPFITFHGFYKNIRKKKHTHWICLTSPYTLGFDNYEKAMPTHLWWLSRASPHIEEMFIIDL